MGAPLVVLMIFLFQVLSRSNADLPPSPRYEWVAAVSTLLIQEASSRRLKLSIDRVLDWTTHVEGFNTSRVLHYGPVLHPFVLVPFICDLFFGGDLHSSISRARALSVWSLSCSSSHYQATTASLHVIVNFRCSFYA